MPAQVTAISGRNCTYYLDGRCSRTRSQAENDEAYCPLMQQRGKLGAKTRDRLNRLEHLTDPKDREVARRHIMQKTSEAIQKLTCPDFEADNKGQLCLNQHLIYCKLRLPRCEGRCDHFMVRTKTPPEAKQK